MLEDIEKACQHIEDVFCNADNCAYDNDCYEDCQAWPHEVLNDEGRRVARTLKAGLDAIAFELAMLNSLTGTPEQNSHTCQRLRAIREKMTTAWKGDDE